MDTPEPLDPNKNELDRVLPGETGEDFVKRKRMVADALSKMGYKSEALSDHEKILQRVIAINAQVLEATTAERLFDPGAGAYTAMAKAYLEHFMHWSKDDLVYVCALSHASILHNEA